jgi:hypothetical protein
LTIYNYLWHNSSSQQPFVRVCSDVYVQVGLVQVLNVSRVKLEAAVEPARVLGNLGGLGVGNEVGNDFEQPPALASVVDLDGGQAGGDRKGVEPFGEEICLQRCT